MFFFTWISVVGVYIFTMLIEYFFRRVSLLYHQHITFKRSIFLLADSLVIASLLYLISQHISYLNGRVLFDVIHSSVILLLLMLLFIHVIFFRDFILYILPGNYARIILNNNEKKNESEVRIYSLSYPFYKILYLPIFNSVLIGENINKWLSIEEVQQIGIAQIKTFKRTIWANIGVFFITSLLFLITLTFIKKALPFSPDYLFQIAVIFWGGLYFILRRRLNISSNSRSNWNINEAYLKVWRKYRLFINSYGKD